MELRNYQKKQLNFLERNEKSEMCGVQSPTGTGKSIMILSYLKSWMDRNPNGIAVLTTGFNQLVFQMEEDARALDLKCKVLIGAAYLVPTCDKKLDSAELGGFCYGKSPTSPCKNCPKLKYKKVGKKIVVEDGRPEECARQRVGQLLDELPRGVLYITNHSYYLTMKDRIVCDLLVVDEAHTFSDFYSSYNTYKMNDSMKLLIESYCNSVYSPTSAIVAEKIKGRSMSKKLIDNAIKEMLNENMLDSERAEKYKNDLENLYEENESSYIDVEDGEPVKYKFYYKYEVPAKKTILLSATLDEYTKKMFGLKNRNQVYVQSEPLDRYSGSFYAPVPESFQDCFLRVLDQLKDMGLPMNNGLVLCNTVENVNWVLQQRLEHELHTSTATYRNSKAEKKMLVGSKRFFQGVNVPDLDFVVLDKLPFATYDNKFRAYEFYLKKMVNCEPWADYTLPLVTNALLQACGRLWRVNDYQNKVYDQGTFIITDPRLDTKFKYLKDFVVKNKPGIKCLSLKEQMSQTE